MAPYLAVICAVLTLAGSARADETQHGGMSVLSSVPMQTKAIALTVDLGCSAGRDAVEKMLLSLDKRDVHCTWFLTGWLLRNMPEFVDQFVTRGDDLANHTDRHPHCRGISRWRMGRELQAVEELLAPLGHEITAPKYFRPPFGEYNATVVDVAAGLDYRTVMWSATTTDYNVHADPTATAHRILARCRPGGIILMHATDVSRRALPIVLDALIEDGYEVVSIRELIHVAHAEMHEAETGGEQ